MNEQSAVRSEKGGWMRLEDFCDSSPRGNGHYYTNSVITMEEELISIELGSRVANEIVSKAVDGWDAFMDALYYETEVRGKDEGSSDRGHAR